MDKTAKLGILKNSLLIFFGSIVYSLGVALFLDPNSFASGGVTGIAIIINTVSGDVLGTGWIILIINVPLFIVGAIFLGRKLIISSIVATALSSALIELWNFTILKYMPPMQNILVPAAIGGVLYGIGLGLIFRAGSTTGGTDIIVKLLRKKFRHLKSGIISMLIDIVIVAASYFICDLETILVTVVSLVIFTFAFDWTLYGSNSAMLVYIITTKECASLMCKAILEELDTGATIIDGKGAYTDTDKTVIMCAVKNFVYPRLRDIIKKYDPAAFTIVSSAKEIYGEGYKPHDAEEL